MEMLRWHKMDESKEVKKLDELYENGFITEPEYKERKELIHQTVEAVKEEKANKKRPRETSEVVTSPYFKRNKPSKDSAQIQTPTLGQTQIPRQQTLTPTLKQQTIAKFGASTKTANANNINNTTNGNSGNNSSAKTIFPPSKKLTSPHGLPDYLREGLKLVIVGDNPGIQSANESSWYAHNTNQFWTLLYQSGLTSTQLGPSTDYKILDNNIGLTCLHSKSTRTVDDVATEDWMKGYELLKEKLLKFKPKYVCFNGKGIYLTITGKQKCSNGIQPPLVIGDMKFGCFVMPSSSARVQTYSLADKVQILKNLAQWIK